MSEFIKVPVKSILSNDELSILTKILNIKPIKLALDNGGFIAGGFARALLRKDPIRKYLSSYKESNPGDIDIFFRHKDHAVATVAQLGKDFYSSQGGFAKEGPSGLVFDASDLRDGALQHFMIQIVDSPDLILPTVEETLLQFDFVNCQVALVGTDLVYPREWHELEEKMLLKISNINAPFMGTRVNKYLRQRGYKGLVPESQEIFQDWLIKAATSDFEGFNDKHKAGLEYAVKSLFANGVVLKESLVLFLGKWKEARASGSYSTQVSYEIDWAQQAIQQSVS